MLLKRIIVSQTCAIVVVFALGEHHGLLQKVHKMAIAILETVITLYGYNSCYAGMFWSFAISTIYEPTAYSCCRCSCFWYGLCW